MSPHRVIVLAACAAAWLASVATARAADPQDACVRLDPHAVGGMTVRLVGASQECARGESRMLALIAGTSLFDAQAKPPIIGTDSQPPLDPPFTATFLVTTVEARLTTPLLVSISIAADLDRAAFGTTREGGGQIDPSAVTCALLVDGRAASTPSALASRDLVGLGVGQAVYDPPTGRSENLQWGDLPDAVWWQAISLDPAPAGTHEYAVQCQAPASFRFLGRGMVDVLQ